MSNKLDTVYYIMNPIKIDVVLRRPSRPARAPRRTVFGWTFWLIVLTSTLYNTAYGGSTPSLARFVEADLGAGPLAAALVVAATPLAQLAGLGLAGFLADRSGYKMITCLGAVLGAVGLAVTALDAGVPAAFAGRLLFGLGGAAVSTCTAAWVVGLIPPHRRGRALSLYGISIWIGLASGPALGEAVLEAWGFAAVPLMCAALHALALLAALAARSVAGPGRGATSPAGGSPAAPLRRPRGRLPHGVVLPGLAALVSWGAEGLLLAHLITHLVSRGLPPTGPFGAAAVFTIFAGSVIAARIVLGSLPDRLGAKPTAGLALMLLAGALCVLAVADSFAAALLGAALLGIAYSPLYPALLMLALAGARQGQQGARIGMFNSFSTLGMALGSFFGGLLISVSSTVTVLLVAAGAQVFALAAVAAARRGSSEGS